MPLISVIMPAYNASKYISEAIESILNQTFTDFELLICDDGSADETLAIIKSYATKDKRIVFFVNEKNIGNLKTTNFLFSKCSGKYVAVQDADDISAHHRIEMLAAAMDKNPKLGIAGANFMIMDEQKTFISCSLLPLNNSEIKNVFDKEVPPLLYGCCMIRRSLLSEVGVFRPIFNRIGYADLDLIYRICEISECSNFRDILYYYRKAEIYKYPTKGLIVKNGLNILVEAHLMRMRGEIDFLETQDFLAIRKFVAKTYFNRAEQVQWDGNLNNALKLYLKAISIYPFNLVAIKNIVNIVILKIS